METNGSTTERTTLRALVGIAVCAIVAAGCIDGTLEDDPEPAGDAGYLELPVHDGDVAIHEWDTGGGDDGASRTPPDTMTSDTAVSDTGGSGGGCQSSQCGPNAHCEGGGCVCDDGFVPSGGAGCEAEGTGACAGITCSGHGECKAREGEPVCICDSGYTPSSREGTDCVETSEVCTGGTVNYDYDNDGMAETTFEPSASECKMYELINRTRAEHDPMGAPECHKPLAYNLEWSAHARSHSRKMSNQGGLSHGDLPPGGGQNVASCTESCAMNLYMTGPNEPHCPQKSHHCNIMRCRFDSVGVGDSGGLNTQNFQ